MLHVAVTAAILLLGAAVAANAANAASMFYIRGGGDGHGVGMSQYGAEGYALHGADYRSILAHYYSGTTLGATNPQRAVRVLLASGQASFSGANHAGAVRLSPAITYEVVATGGKKLQLRAAGGGSAGTFSAPLTVSGSGPLHVPGLGSYRGALQFSPAGGGATQTVNIVGVDDYVRGVVAKEMPPSWAPAALQAQAVAARTFAITTSVGGSGYDLYDDDRSQVYGGAGGETPTTDAAVAATRGQIVTYAGRPAATYFFASSGGYTESVEDAWPGAAPEPWLRAVPDPYDGAAGNPYHRWGAQMRLTAAAARLTGLVRGALIGISVVRHLASPRIITAHVVGTGGRTTVTAAQLQSLFGLSSTLAAFTTIVTDGAGGQLTGTIFPAPTTESVVVQSAVGRHWRTVAHAGLSPAGAYIVPVAPGRYRVVAGGVDGPAVAAG